MITEIILTDKRNISPNAYNKCNSLATSSARMELPTCNFSKIFCR